MERIQLGEESSFGNDYSEISKISTKTLAEMAYNGNEEALAVFRKSAARLGQGLSLIIDILNPEVIGIGSVFARSESLFRNEMERVIAKEALAESVAAVRIRPASLGDSIGDVAAISVAMED